MDGFRTCPILLLRKKLFTLAVDANFLTRTQTWGVRFPAYQ